MWMFILSAVGTQGIFETVAYIHVVGVEVVSFFYTDLFAFT